MITVCPSEEELLAVASGETPSGELDSHLQDCGRCLRKVNGLKLQVRGLQQAFRSIEQAATPAPHPPATVLPIFGDPPAAAPSQQTSHDRERIGKYLIVSALGSGGQASVYRAIHPALDEQVVIKLSSRMIENAEAAKNDRLISEGRVLCQLKHSNIGRIYDLDFFERRPFLVMEFVRGRSLDQYMRDRIRLTSREIAALAAKVARALEAAHRFGIVHQDVKPQNIIIDEHGEPRLIDFGMARLNGAWTEGQRQPLGGTIQYMSPEQARCETDRITGRSDVFSLGAVLYFLITNAPPFCGTSQNELLGNASRCQFDRTALKEANVPPRLKQVVLRAMEARPEDRFGGAREMAEALEAVNRAGLRRRILIRAVPAVIALAAVGATAWFWPRAAANPASGQLLITPDGSSTLDGHLPLITGEKVKIEGAVPRGTPAVVFWVGSAGQVFRMRAAQQHGTDPFDHVISPGASETIALSGPPGTECVLVVAGRDLADSQKVDALESDLKTFFVVHSLGSLPPTGAVLVDAAGAHARFLDGGERPRDPGAETADGCAGVSTPLEELSGTLKQKGYFFAGIAVPHQDSQQ